MPGHSQVHQRLPLRDRRTLRISARPLPSRLLRAAWQSVRGYLQDWYAGPFLRTADKLFFAVRRQMQDVPKRVRRSRNRLFDETLPTLRTGFTNAIPRLSHPNHAVFKAVAGLSVMSTITVIGVVPAEGAPLIGDALIPVRALSPTQQLRVPQGFVQVIDRQNYKVVEFYMSPSRKSPYFKAWLADGGLSVDEMVRRYKNATYDRFDAAMLATDAIGIPYVFGGDSPGGFDCSGLVRNIFAHFGIALPHSVTAIDSIGERVSRANATAGDLVIWNDHSHMGIYMGDGKIVHAPRSGTFVEYRDLWDTNVHFVRINK